MFLGLQRILLQIEEAAFAEALNCEKVNTKGWVVATGKQGVGVTQAGKEEEKAVGTG